MDACNFIDDPWPDSSFLSRLSLTYPFFIGYVFDEESRGRTVRDSAMLNRWFSLSQHVEYSGYILRVNSLGVIEKERDALE